MAEARPSLDEWRRLYEAANHLKELAPWDWMEEVDVFGVQDPESGEMGFVSIMGQIGEHFALALYLGADALSRFWDMERDPASVPEALLTIPELQLSFEDRDELTSEDRAVIKALGLKYRGRQAWPQFRSYRPGFFPWYLEPAEARFLAYAIEQALEVTPRAREDPELLAPAGEDAYLVRVPREEDGSLVWRDETVTVPPTVLVPVDIPMDMALLRRAKQLPRMTHALEVSYTLVPVAIGEKGARPRYPYMLLAVDAVTGFVYASEFVEAEATVERSWAQAPLTLLRHLVRLEMVPQEIDVASFSLAQILRPLTDELGCRLELRHDLPALDEAMAAFAQRFL